MIMRLNHFNTAAHLSATSQKAPDEAARKKAETAASTPSNAADRIKPANGGVTQRRLMAHVKRPASRSVSRGSSEHGQHVQTLATDAVMRGSAAEQNCLLAAFGEQTVVGPDGHTLKDEFEQFGKMTRPGFSPAQSADERAESFLGKLVGASSVTAMADKVMTAATRVGSPLHSLVNEARKEGLVPAWLQSAISAELSRFPGGLRAGFF
jgi:hypothetical protein